MAKARYKKGRRAPRTIGERDGEQVRVSRADGTAGTGTLRCEFDAMGRLGRVFVEGLKMSMAFAKLGDWTLFRAAFTAAIDIQMKGFPDWWMISGAPVELSRYNSELFRGKTYTLQRMEQMGYKT